MIKNKEIKKQNKLFSVLSAVNISGVGLCVFSR